MKEPHYTLDELVQKTTEIVEDTKYMLKKARVPSKKRSAANAVAFWTAINDNLVTYRQLLKDSTID